MGLPHQDVGTPERAVVHPPTRAEGAATETWCRYYGRVFAQFQRDIGPRFEWAMVTVFLAAVSPFLLERFGYVPAGQLLNRALSVAIAVLVVLTLYSGYHAIRAPWKVHKETHARRDEAAGEIRRSQREVQERLDVAHGETKASLTAVQKELETEREKNQRPDISVRIVDGMYWGRVQGDSIADDGHHVRRKKIYIALVIEFGNSRPQSATIDRWELIVETGDGHLAAELTIQQELTSARVFPKRTMEECLMVPYGQTVRRCEHFSIEGKRPVNPSFPDWPS